MLCVERVLELMAHDDADWSIHSAIAIENFASQAAAFIGSLAAVGVSLFKRIEDQTKMLR